MEERKSPEKIKKEKQVYWHQKNDELTWGDIKHLQLEDDDRIRSCWMEDHEAEYGGYWHGEIIRMIEETDEQFRKRIESNKKDDERRQKMRYESYLKLKKEFENESE
jgi:hypothetical protein